MPSTQTNLKMLERKIRELEEKDVLSDANTRHLRFLQLWREHGMKDVVLYVVPRGAINRGTANEPRFVEVTDMVAADLLAYADARNQTVRLATEEEVIAFRATLEQERQAHLGAIASHQAQVTQAAARALLGDTHSLPPGVAPTGPAVAPPKAPPAVAKSAPEPVSEPKPEEASAPGPLLAEITSPKIVEALTDAGYSTVQAVADADPQDLAAKVEGVGAARAAELIAKASEAVAKPPATGGADA